MNTIGILIDSSKYRRIPTKKYGHERLDFYNKAAKTYGLEPFYFTLKNINFSKGTVKGYIYKNGKYILQVRPIPKVIHNRAMALSKPLNIKTTKLARVSYLYNSRTRYSKYYIHQLLATSYLIRPYIPYTLPFTQDNLISMIRTFPSLYIKPSSGSIGLGIIKITKLTSNNRWKVQYAKTVKAIPAKQLYPLLRKIIMKRNYIIQQTVPLAKVNGGNFDIRVTVQRNESGKWQVTGMIAKAAKPGKHVTNVARGGKVYRLESVLRKNNLNIMNTKKSIENLSLAIADQLSKNLVNLSDMGLDLGVDVTGKPYFIELNGRDLRYSFQLGKMYETWYNTFKNPIAYGKYIISTKSN